MSSKTLFYLWGGLFILCAGLGFTQPATGIYRGALLILSLIFFLPPSLILHFGSSHERKLIRNLSALSLGLTVALLLVNFLTAMESEELGLFLHGILTIVSTPMVCSGYWVVSLFLWACLLTVSLKEPLNKSSEAE